MVDDLSENALEEALIAMRKYSDDSGKKLSVKATKILLRPSDFPGVDLQKWVDGLDQRLSKLRKDND